MSQESKDTILIKRDFYVMLLVESEKLKRLERGGVDNWEWYDEALNPPDEPDIDAVEEMLKETYGLKK
jgi:hypothetical protein